MNGRWCWHAAGISIAAIAMMGWQVPDLRAQEDVLASCDERGVTWGVGPGLVRAGDGKNIGIMANLRACFTGQKQLAPVDSAGLQDGYPASYTLRLAIDAAWSLGSANLPQTSTIGASAGWSVSLAKPDLIAPDTLDINALPDWDGGGFNRGWVELGAAVDHEADSDWGEQNLVGSTQLRYGLVHRGWFRMVPSVLAHLDAVVPLTSEARDASGIKLRGHVRWGARAYWSTGLDFVTPRLATVRLRADLALYRTSGLEDALVQEGWSEGEYATVTLSREKSMKLVGPIEIGSIYVRYMDGRWPTIPVGDRAVTAGFTIRRIGG